MNQNKNLRIKRYYSIIAHSPDHVELRFGVWNPISFSLNDESKKGYLFKILNSLDGSHSPAEIEKEENVPRGEVEALIDHLEQLGVLEAGASNTIDYYLDHFVPYTQQLASKTRNNSPVVLIGDPDITMRIKRNLEESLMASDIEMTGENDPLWQSLAERDTSWLINGLEFQKKVKIFEKWRNKFIVFAQKSIDPIQFQILNRVSLEYRFSWLHVALDGPFLFMGPIVIPYRSSCYNCFETRVMMNLRESASYQSYKKAIIEKKIKYGDLPFEPVLLELLASYASLETLNFVLTKSSFTVSKVLAIHVPTMEITFNEILRVPGCTACGSSPERDDRELYFDIKSLIKKM